MIVSVVGPPLAGKSSVSAALVDHIRRRDVRDGVELISSGDAARSLAGVGTVGDALRSGELAPPGIMDGYMRALLQAAAATSSIVVVEGYPRYMEQMADLLWVSHTSGRPLAFVCLRLEHSRLLERAQERRREDDSAETVMMRLQKWHEKGSAVVDFLATRSWVPSLTVLSDGGADVVADTVHQWLRRVSS